MTGFTSIDLGKLPKPDVIQLVEYDALLAEMKAEMINRVPEMAAYLSLESEPVTQLLRIFAYFRMLDRLAFNDGSRANMLALSTGTNLDGLAAFWGVERLIIQEADTNVEPPIPEIKEGDAAFRKRVQLSLEGHTTAGPVGAYTFWALSADGDVKDVAVQSPVPGEVLVTVLSHTGDGAPAPALISTVLDKLNEDDVRPLTDHVTVQAASIIAYQVEASLTLYEGADEVGVIAAARAAVREYVATHHVLGHDITLSGLHAALHQSGVQNVTLTHPAADIVVSPVEAGYCPDASITVSYGGRDV